jgi:trans-aconitate methyltransferase
VNAEALSSRAFESRYAHGADPWSFADSPYELARYRTTVRSLHKSAYETVYEPACAIGVLTRQLAAFATRVLATDFAPSAVAQAKVRCAQLDNVEIYCADLRTFTPEIPIDLIVMSEVGYYFSAAELARIASDLAACLVAGGEFVAVHWLGSSQDHVLHGNEVHDVLGRSLGLRPLKSELHRGFRLDSWAKP